MVNMYMFNVNNTDRLCGGKAFEKCNAVNAHAISPLQCLCPTPFPCPNSFASHDYCTHMHVREIISISGVISFAERLLIASCRHHLRKEKRETLNFRVA